MNKQISLLGIISKWLFIRSAKKTLTYDVHTTVSAHKILADVNNMKISDPPTEDFSKNDWRERLVNSHNDASRLSGILDYYKIKLRQGQAGLLLVNQVRDSKLVMVLAALGKRKKQAVEKSCRRCYS